MDARVQSSGREKEACPPADPVLRYLHPLSDFIFIATLLQLHFLDKEPGSGRVTHPSPTGSREVVQPIPQSL